MRVEFVGFTASALAIDGQTARLTRRFQAAGIDSILLKGPSFASWLYESGERRYSDSDILIDPESEERASKVLMSLGYWKQLSAPALEEHASTWTDRRTNLEVDLHTTIWGWGDGEAVWRGLQAHTRSVRVGKLDLRVLDEPAMAVHVVTHALQPSMFEHWTTKKHEDLRRALTKVPDETWEEALDLARSVGADEAFAVGLHLQPAGVALCRRLGIEMPRDMRPEIRFASVGASHSGAPAIEEFVAAKDVRARASLVIGRVLPTYEWARFVVAQQGWSERGRFGTYVLYWWHLIRKTPGAVRAWRAAR